MSGQFPLGAMNLGGYNENSGRPAGVDLGRDDGAHTRPVRSTLRARNKVAIAAAAVVVVAIAIFGMRATGDRYERLDESACTIVSSDGVCLDPDPGLLGE